MIIESSRAGLFKTVPFSTWALIFAILYRRWTKVKILWSHICDRARTPVNVTTNVQSLLYLCLVLSGFVKHNRNFPCQNLLLWDRTPTRYNYRIMSTWGKYEKSIKSWVQCIRNKRIKAPGRPHFFILHHPPTLEASTFPTEIMVPTKIAHSWISSHWNLFITLICGIQVFYIATN